MPRENSNRDYYPEGRSHREANYAREEYFERGGGGAGRAGADVDPEYDARNYRLLKAKQEKALERQRLAKEQQRQGGGASAVLDKETLEYEEYQMARERDQRRKHKKKKKRRRGESNERRSRKSKVLVEYDDVSSESEVYSAADSPASGSQGLSHHSHHHSHSGSHRASSGGGGGGGGGGRSRVTPPPEKRRRAPSPGSAILAYQKELLSRSHSNSPAHVSRDRSPSSRGRSRKSHRADVSPPPKAAVPKAYADPPKAYRTATDSSPSSSRSRHRQHSRSPSPHAKKYSSPVSPHKYVSTLFSCCFVLGNFSWHTILRKFFSVHEKRLGMCATATPSRVRLVWSVIDRSTKEETTIVHWCEKVLLGCCKTDGQAEFQRGAVIKRSRISPSFPPHFSCIRKFDRKEHYFQKGEPQNAYVNPKSLAG